VYTFPSSRCRRVLRLGSEPLWRAEANLTSLQKKTSEKQAKNKREEIESNKHDWACPFKSCLIKQGIREFGLNVKIRQSGGKVQVSLHYALQLVEGVWRILELRRRCGQQTEFHDSIRRILSCPICRRFKLG
jgi:hypothetical protein